MSTSRPVVGLPGGDTTARTGEDWLDQPLTGLVRRTGASVGMIFLLPPGQRMLRLAAVSGASPEIAMPWSGIPLDAELPILDAMRHRRLFWVESQEDMARRYPRLGLLLPYEFMLAAAPVASGRVVWGGVVLLFPVWHPSRPSRRERRILAAACREIASLADGAVGSAALECRTPRFLPPPALRHDDPERALAALAFTERLPIGCCALDLHGRVTFLNAAAARMLDVGAAPVEGRRLWDVLLWLHDQGLQARYQEAVITRMPSSFTVLRPPDLRFVLHLHPDAGGISIRIRPEELDAEPLAAPAALAGPDNAPVFNHVTHLAAALAEAASVEQVAALVADHIVPSLGPEALAMLTSVDGRLRITGHRGFSADATGLFDAAPLDSSTPAARVLETGRPSFYPTFGELRREYPHALPVDGMAAWAFLPMTASGRKVGTLVLAYRGVHGFSPAERSLLTALAGLVAQPLDRAMAAETERALAHTLQTHLLPHSLPRLPALEVAARYMPARHGMDIGGDFYDLLTPTSTTAVAAIGDVQGHNTTAAALMGQVRTAVHAHATIGTPPGGILARTNQLLADLDPGLFTTCLVTHLDLERHQARFASAGHPPPLLRHPDGRTEILDVPPGVPLGILPDARYATTRIRFPPGSILVLYTDGLVEVPGQDLGESLRDLAGRLSGADPSDLSVLAEALLRHPGPHNDDTALLLMRLHAPGNAAPADPRP
ncbi:SpoIIE family protein phosphatase [Streptomyces sp. NPDC090306]|uniref:SpoIIE family protein phosphatase n=1 Tax=Streptomyces sp. NPDC090306 TaxID=3365961 RepID=UPI0037F81443